jgi:hypothetical protein
VRAIRFCFDASNSTSKHIGKSRALNARCYVLSIENNELIIKMNLGLQAGQIYSVGRYILIINLFFLLSESVGNYKSIKCSDFNFLLNLDFLSHII